MIGVVQLRSVPPKSHRNNPFLLVCMNRNPIRYGTGAGVKVIWYKVNIASVKRLLPALSLAFEGSLLATWHTKKKGFTYTLQ